MKKPNFFIIGAPKCGTTSLATYLGDHPEIFFSRPKELYFFSTDLKNGNISSLTEYSTFFKEALPEHKAVGEGTALYLYSKNAVSNILEYNPSVKFIVMLRNPVDLAYSWHYQLLFQRDQKIHEFERAWRLQEELASDLRKKGRLAQSKLVLYSDICKIGEQMEKLYRIVKKEDVLVILYDDLKHEPETVYKESLKFLGVSLDHHTELKKYNESKINRSLWLADLLRQTNLVVLKLKKSLGIQRPLFGIIQSLMQYNSIKIKRHAMPKEFREELVEYFREDVQKLSYLINRDLSHWQ